MRILQTHSDFIEFEPIQKEIQQAEHVDKKKQRFENILVLFTSVEQGDNEEIAKKSIDDVNDFLKKLKINKILIYPFAHLSRNLAKPNHALKIIEEMEKHAKELKIETHRAPFGWNKQLNLKTKAHPLAEQSRVYLPKELEKKEVSLSEIRKSKITSEKLTEKDHRIIGQQLDLFSFQEPSPGIAFFHPKGMILRNILINFWRKEHAKRGYQEISTPIMMNKNIWEVSGHVDHFRENMFFTQVEDQDFALKPMNCPGAILVYKSATRSYRDLPLKFAELGTISRNELSGVLSGLFRLRQFTQDDAHIFVRYDQIEKEILEVVDLIDHFYKKFGFDYQVELSTRPEKFMGKKEDWDRAQKYLEEALKKKGMKYKLNPGEGAFYGPKIDFHIKDSLGRSWQCATCQVDFQLPERFKLSFIGKDGKEYRPAIIHRVVYGAIERFIGILVEHFEGKFPVWLSPIQARVLSISDENLAYSKEVFEEFQKEGIRTDSSFQSNTLEYKIREASMQKIPYIIIIGSKEQKNKTIAVRDRSGKTQYNVKVNDFVKKISEEAKY